eukprot:CAMPEP_0117448894 /NCGR_PEP_ID=MMETSP0759-20121206/7647_1 /TAXON_ID=63605 /ORGANISM="Percolomonas cosmopolitus, Strain WS" /LENGTH=374 /DNA_ID=CAMNT_0005241317 /DNA_START=400 /DNA_END=1524 /DNA_ORIENTATION=-
MSRYTQLGYAASVEAMKDAGLLEFHSDQHSEKHSFRTHLDKHNIEPHRIGVCIGSGTTSLQEVAENYELVKSGNIRRISPFFVPKILGNITSGWVSIDMGLQGPNLSPVTACATGAHALGDSLEAIRRGDADCMVAGGTEACLDPITFAGFCRLRALCMNRNDDAEHSSRPFDKGRSGFVMGEGAGIMVLEELDHALKRGARIYGELVGYGRSGDAFHLTSPEVTGRGAVHAMRMALEDASSTRKIHIDEVKHVNAHATSTPMGDEIEYKAIQKLRDGSSSTIHVNSIKGALGHCIGAAGSIESIASVLSLQYQQIPGTQNFQEADFDYSPEEVHIVKEATSLDFEYALSNSFGFGGTNVSLLFSRWSQDNQAR